MAGTTTNNGWDYPTSTDLLKDGALAIQTLATDIDTSVGTGLLAWTAYTPTFGGVTVGNGTTSFWYSRIGKTVFVKGRFTLGSTSAITGSITVSYPVVERNNISTYAINGNSTFFNNSVLIQGQNFYSSNKVNLQALLSNGTYVTGTPTSGSVPFTWVSGNSFTIEFVYEAA
jgi:hypothetical protein